ncbi:hypothetical protein EHQ23_13280 [Leptospira bourretii]|uniref:DUF2846 domain-containing protein n=1 Tax=Leptospira bourretii TaxID=2484962 RepID=A0A4R9ITC4_9LEPT|nr:hypothetical protein [Leptospira bourretii]TGK85608.1 hypothetical protein EHQ23_13280 [Leptospira bourretii]TGK94505.1 hypothetical protein EHQ26_00710 [Leptospira bourretii]TGL33178.1 hypothetical protein EHQ45_10940 [Leptospira bourretii]
MSAKEENHLPYFAILFFLTCIVGFTMQCTSKKSFVKLVTKENETGLLYLVRPDHTSLSIWNYDCLISRYPDKFSSSIKPTPIFKIELENASLGFIRLPEGTYRLDVIGKEDTTKVFQIKKGEEKYFELKIFSETKLSRSELTFKEFNKESALAEILSTPTFTESRFESVQMPIE